MRLTRLTDGHTGKPLALNPAMVVALRPNGEGGTSIVTTARDPYGHGYIIEVTERFEDVSSRLTLP